MKQRRPKNTLKSMAVMGIMAVVSASSAVAGGPPRSAIQTYVPPPANYNGGQTTKEFMAELEELKLLANVERRFSEAEVKVGKLTTRAIEQEILSPGSLNCPYVVTESTLAHADILEALGRKAEALAKLQALIGGDFPALKAPKKEPEVKAAKTLRTAIETSAKTHIHLAKKVAELSAETQQGAGPVLDDLVAQLANQGNWDSIHQLGSHAVAPLTKHLQAMPLDQFIQPDADFLVLLAALDDVAAANFILTNLDKGGALWRQRVMNTIESTGALSSLSGWDLSAGYPSNPLRVHWIRVLERLAVHQDAASETIRLMRPVADHGALTAPLQQAMIRAIQGGETRQVQAVFEALGSPFRNPSAKPVFEAALSSPSDHVRVFAAQKLIGFEECPALLGRANDSCVAVRHAVAQSLSKRSVKIIVGFDEVISPSIVGSAHPFELKAGIATTPQTRNLPMTPHIQQRERQLIAELLGDADRTVRESAYEALTELDEPLDGSVYVQLTTDPSASVRRGVASRVLIHSPELQAKIMQGFAGETSTTILKEIDKALSEVSWSEHTELFLPVFRARWTHPRNSIRQLRMTETRWSPIITKIRQTPVGLSQLVEWAIEDEDAFLGWQICDDKESLVELQPAHIRALFPVLAKSNIDRVNFLATWIRDDDDGAALRAAMFVLADDKSLPLQTRILAASCAAETGGSELVEKLSALLLDPSLKDENIANGPDYIRSTAGKVARKLQPADMNDVLLNLVSNRDSVDMLAAYVCNYFGSNTPRAGELSKEIINRWFDSDGIYEQRAVLKAIIFMGQHTEHADIAVLMSAVTREQYINKTVEAMGKVRSPVFFAPLEEILRTRPDTQVWRIAAGATVQYMNDEAAELLLKAAAWAADDDGRQMCLDGLESIRTFQDAQERWAQRRVKAKDRDAVVADLVQMLDDEDIVIQVEAIRTLGSFGVVEQMPRLIRMLKHERQEIREAARQALDVLHHAQLSDKQ